MLIQFRKYPSLPKISQNYDAMVLSVLYHQMKKVLSKLKMAGHTKWSKLVLPF